MKFRPPDNSSRPERSIVKGMVPWPVRMQNTPVMPQLMIKISHSTATQTTIHKVY
jgi:hypothetical protein